MLLSSKLHICQGKSQAGCLSWLMPAEYCLVSLCLALQVTSKRRFLFWAALYSLSWHRLKPTACNPLPCPSLDMGSQAGRQSWLLGCMLSKYFASSKQPKLVLPHCRYIKQADPLAAHNPLCTCSIASIQRMLHLKLQRSQQSLHQVHVSSWTPMVHALLPGRLHKHSSLCVKTCYL